MKKIFVLSISILLLMITGCSKVPKLENGEEVVASIEGKEFTANDLYEKLRKQYGANILTNLIDEYIANKEIETDDAAKEYADSTLAQYKLQYEQSGKDFSTILAMSGYKNENAFKEVLITDYKIKQVAKKYIKEKVTEKELKEYYDKNISDELNVKHILIKPDTDDDASSEDKEKAENEALEKAKEMIKKLDEGANFDDLAKENSDDTGSASKGGLIENVTKEGYVKEFYEAAVKLEDGKYTTEPVKSEFGYHVILKVSSKPKKSFDEMKDDLYNSVVEEKMNDDASLSDKIWDEVRKKYDLKINDTDLNNTYKSTISNLKNKQ